MVFQTRVVAIGPEAQQMITETGMFILFGEGAPSDLADYCFTIDNKTLSGAIVPGQTLCIDEQCFTITAVGGVVEKNLSQLGHITVNLDGAKQPSLPGTLHVEGNVSPIIKAQTLIQIK